MIISHKYQFIFIKTRKTAGTSIETYLSPFCGENDILTPFGRQEEGHHPRNYAGFFNPFPEIVLTRGRHLKNTFQDLQVRKRFYNHIPAFLVRCRIKPNTWNNYYKFCVERNPWDKTLSHYNFVKNRFDLNLSLDQYLDRGFNCLDYQKYTDFHDQKRILVDRIIRYERLDTELGEVFDILGIPFKGELGVYAKRQYRTDRKSYDQVLSPIQKERIGEIYEHELDLFNYKF